MSRAQPTTKNVYTVVSFYTERADVTIFGRFATTARYSK